MGAGGKNEWKKVNQYQELYDWYADLLEGVRVSFNTSR
jgi:hypothetical protein